MRTTGEVRWFTSFDDDVRDGTAAWIVGLDACRNLVGRLAANPTDLADIGARRGVDADHFLQRRLTLRCLVGRWCEVPAETVAIGYGPAGRPEVLHPRDGPRCSVTARGDVAGFAMSSACVGIDLEPIESGDIAWAALSPSERSGVAELREAERHAAFLDLWTVKEAYLKALGSGLLRDPAAITVSVGRDRLLRDGRDTWRLSASAVHHGSIGDRPVTAACISLR